MEHAGGIHCGAGLALVCGKEAWGHDGRDRFLQPFLGISRAEEPVHIPGILEAGVHVQRAAAGSPVCACSAAAWGQGRELGTAKHGAKSPLQSVQQTWALGCSYRGGGIAPRSSWSAEESPKSYRRPASVYGKIQ